MIAVVPMAGESKRFVEAGYTVPKPFLPMADRRMMFEHVIDSLPDDTEEVNILVRKEHHGYISEYRPTRFVTRFLEMAGRKTLGPLDTILWSHSRLNKDTELIINYCDCFVSREQMTLFVNKMRELKRYAGVVCFPSDDMRFQREPLGKFCMSGIFWFKSAKHFLHTAIPYRDDPHMSPGHIAYSMRWMGLPMCKTWVTDDYVDLGVPQSYELYKALKSAVVIPAEKDA